MCNLQIKLHFGATYMDWMTGDPPFLSLISKGDLTRIAYAKFHGILIVGYILNELKWILSFRCHCHLVEYLNMPLTGKTRSTASMSF